MPVIRRRRKRNSNTLNNLCNIPYSWCLWNAARKRQFFENPPTRLSREAVAVRNLFSAAFTTWAYICEYRDDRTETSIELPTRFPIRSGEHTDQKLHNGIYRNPYWSSHLLITQNMWVVRIAASRAALTKSLVKMVGQDEISNQVAVRLLSGPPCQPIVGWAFMAGAGLVHGRNSSIHRSKCQICCLGTGSLIWDFSGI